MTSTECSSGLAVLREAGPGGGKGFSRAGRRDVFGGRPWWRLECEVRGRRPAEWGGTERTQAGQRKREGSIQSPQSEEKAVADWFVAQGNLDVFLAHG